MTMFYYSNGTVFTTIVCTIENNTFSANGATQ